VALPTLVVTRTVGPFTFVCTVERPVPSRPPHADSIACKSQRFKKSPPNRIRCEMRRRVHHSVNAFVRAQAIAWLAPMRA
jgi:hypothetical protein